MQAYISSSWFLAVTYDGTEFFDNVRFYHGDEGAAPEQLGFTLSALGGSLPVMSETASINVGLTDVDLTVDYAVDGYQDDIRIYDTVLSAAQLDSVRLENLGPSEEEPAWEITVDFVREAEGVRVVVSWDSEIGQTYVVERSPDLQSDWVALGDGTEATGVVSTFEDLPPQRDQWFYRVREIPPAQ